MTKQPDKPAIDFEKVELVRERMQLTISEMASLLGVSRATYYAWTGGGPIRPRNARKVKDVLKEILPLLKDEAWPVPGVRTMTSKERMSALIDILEQRA